MTEDIHPAVRRQSIGEVLDGNEVVSLSGARGIESTVEAGRQLQLTDLCVVRGKGARFFEPATHTYRHALDTFVWGLSPKHKVTLIFAFDKTGGFSLHTQFSAEGPDRQEATHAAANLVAGFDATLAAAALDFRFADDAGTDLAEWHSTWR